jgi:hypothetical protein
MPKHLDYQMAAERNINGLLVIDGRPDEEKHFRERIDSDTSYFYGDDNFDFPLPAIFKNRLASNFPDLGKTTEITVNSIVLAASINDGAMDERAYQNATNQARVGNGIQAQIGKAIARPIVEAIQKGNSRRSIWCRIDYTVDGKASSEIDVNSAKYSALKEDIVRMYLQVIDDIGVKLSRNEK